MGKMSREKGKRGEREFAAVCASKGFKARRGQQFCGSNGDADVVGLPGIHIECKRVEALNIYTAIAQSTHDAKNDELPIVAHRKNNCKWLITMEAGDWFALYREWFNATKETENVATLSVRKL